MDLPAIAFFALNAGPGAMNFGRLLTDAICFFRYAVTLGLSELEPARLALDAELAELDRINTLTVMRQRSGIPRILKRLSTDFTF
jgi:hypothetical protein